jgi:hypothetical protein
MPAFVVNQYLNNSFGPQFSLLLILLALYCYDKKKILSYLFSFIALGVYEAPYILLFTAPLLQHQRDIKSYIKDSIQNTLILSAIIMIYFYKKSMSSHDSNFSHQFIIDPLRIVLGSLKGIKTCLISYFDRFQYVFGSFSFEHTMLFIFMFLLFFYVLTSIFKSKGKAELDGNGTHQSLKTINIVLWASFCLILAYLPFLLKAVHNPENVKGFYSRIHLVSKVGGATLISLVFYYLLNTSSRITRTILSSLIAVFFSLLVLFGYTIQKQYIGSWIFTRQVYCRLAPHLNDIKNADMVLLHLRERRLKEEYIYNFSGKPLLTPILHKKDCKKNNQYHRFIHLTYRSSDTPLHKALSFLRKDGQLLKFYSLATWSKFGTPVKNIIYLKENKQGKCLSLQRITGTIHYKGININLINTNKQNGSVTFLRPFELLRKFYGGTPQECQPCNNSG